MLAGAAKRTLILLQLKTVTFAFLDKITYWCEEFISQVSILRQHICSQIKILENEEEQYCDM